MCELFKNIFISCAVLFLCCVFVYAKAPQLPAWYNSPYDIYPRSEYLAQKGTGKNAEEAKINALAELSKVISTSIQNQETADSYLQQNNGTALNHKELEQHVTVSTQSELSGVEYSEVFYLKKIKEYSCVAYLNREAAWEQQELKIKGFKRAFRSLYDEGNELLSAEPLASMIYLQKAQKQAADGFIPALEYGRILLAGKAAAYDADAELYYGIPAQIVLAQRASTMFISVTGDENSMVSSKLTTLFADAGYPVSTAPDRCRYIVKGVITKNLQIDDADSQCPAYGMFPVLELSVKGVKTGSEPLYSYSVEGGKTVGLDKNFTARSAVKKIADQLDSKIIDDMTAKITGLN